MTRLLIKNGRVCDPFSSLDEERDLLVEDGKIKEVSRNLQSGPSTEVIDARGKTVLPGLIDMHVHLRDPGRQDKETIYSGTRAAAAGGFTSVACMPNTDPVIDNSSVVEYILSKARTEGCVNVFVVGSVTKGQAGQELSEMGFMSKAGAVAFSDDGKCVMRSDVMRRALEYAVQFNKVIISHCEDHSLTQGAQMNESSLSTIMGLKGYPCLAEEIMVEREIGLAREFGRVHIAHVSTAGSVARIRRAKEEGIRITCETAPHYFCLTETEVEGYNTNAKVNPPLRGEKDVEAVILGLKDGTIDVIASDHAPHTIDEKNTEFALAASGIDGLETSFGLAVSELLGNKILTLGQLVEKMTLNPARILGLKKGTLSVGADADITIADLGREFAVDTSKFVSKSSNSPFDGWKLKGKILYTIVGGQVVLKDGSLTK